MTREDYHYYDYIIGVDHWNLKNMHHLCDGDPENKISLLMDQSDRLEDVVNPWYTSDFETTWDDTCYGCEGLLEELINHHP